MRYRRRPASVTTAAALLIASGSVAAELLPGVRALDRRLAVDARLPPWNAIAKVQTNIATRCTGALVGPDTVMTAAHCLYNRRTHALLRPGSLHVLFGYERSGYFRHAQVVRFVVGEGFDGAEPARHPASDWARLELAEAVPPAMEPLRLSKELPVPGTAVALPATAKTGSTS
jgi:protease YdgD